MIRYLAGTDAGAFPIIGFSPTAGHSQIGRYEISL